MRLIEILLVVLVAVLLFAPKKLPQLAESLGKSARAFRDALKGDDKKSS
jgi:TatA/E family protein of Tat protein translocase